MPRRWLFFVGALVIGVALDVWTKQWALNTLQPHQTVYAWGGILKLTLSFNTGAAFGLSLGAASRIVFITFSFVVLVWLGLVYRRTPHGEISRQIGITLVSAGAVGNLIDRVASSRGVTDFLGPYDLGFMLWPIFNVADCYVVVGISFLLFSMRHGGITEQAGEVGSAAASAAESAGAGAAQAQPKGRTTQVDRVAPDPD